MISNRIKYLLDFCIGDGHLGRYMYSSGSRGGEGGYHYKLTHSFKQREYLMHKIGILTKLGFSGRLDEYEKSLNGKLFPLCEYIVHIDPDIKTAYKYIINKGRKAIDKHLLRIFDARSLAYWYLDDGSPNKTTKSSSSPGNGYRYYYTYPVQKLSQMRLYTYSFSFQEQSLIKDWLKEKFDINASLVNGRDGMYIKVCDINERKKFISTIESYVTDMYGIQNKRFIKFSGYISNRSKKN